MPRKEIHLAAHFPGVNNTTVWSDPAAGSHIEFASFVRFAQAAERGRFDFLFLAEGLRLREQKGRIHDLYVVGRPESITVLNALAAVTERLGLPSIGTGVGPSNLMMRARSASPGSAPGADPSGSSARSSTGAPRIGRSTADSQVELLLALEDGTACEA